MSILHFADARPDLAIQAQWQREYWTREYPLVKLHRIDRVATEVDDLWHESTDWQFKAPIEVRAHVEHNPSRQSLRRMGIEEPRDIVVSFSTILLDDQGLLENNSTFLIGDLVQFDEDLYEILSQHRTKEGYWTQTNVPFFFDCPCNRYREGK